MSDPTEATVADVGQTIQKGLNRSGEARDHLVQFIRDRLISAVIIAFGVGYVLAKII